MRRTIASATLGLALFFAAAACADVPQEEPGASTSPTNKATAATLADKKTTCEAYLKLDADMTAKSGPVISDLQAAQNDPIKGLAAIATMNTLIADYEAKLTPIAAQSSDTEVKTALDAELTKTRKIKAELAAAGTDPVKLQAVFENVDDKEGNKIKSLCA